MREGEKKIAFIMYRCGLVVLAFGIITLCGGMIEQHRLNEYKNRCMQTIGTVIDYTRYERHGSGERYGSCDYAAIYEYEVNGVKYSFEDNIVTATSPNIGDVTVIYYDPMEPDQGRTTFSSILGTLLSMVGRFFTTAGLMWTVLLKIFIGESEKGEMTGTGIDRNVIRRIVGICVIVFGIILVLKGRGLRQDAADEIVGNVFVIAGFIVSLLGIKAIW